MRAELIKRFRQFAIDVALLINDLPKNIVNNTYNGQLIRLSSSSGANYRASQRGKSTADFINKLKIVEEELDESIFFLDLLHFFNIPFQNRMDVLMKEANELLAITVASIKTARNNNK